MKFKIKSKLKNYNLEFIDSYKKKIQRYNKSQLFIIDRNVFNLFFKNQIEIKNFILINSSEENKSYQKIATVITKILKKKLNKKDKIIAIGGGVTQDITSFICSIYFRGVDWDFFPTTLLAQGDSCIGGKTSINFGKFKNQLGNFNPPSDIYVDTNFLKKLKKKDIQSGIGEMAHLLAVKSYFNFNLISKYYREEISLKDLIIKSLLSKKYYIEKDEFDKNDRLKLNYGHTFGHALENLLNIPHGIAVAHGMNISNFISANYNFISQEKYYEMRDTLNYITKDYNIGKINLDKFLKLLKKDKKSTMKNIRVILTKDIGKMFVYTVVNEHRFKSNLSKYFNPIINYKQ